MYDIIDDDDDDDNDEDEEDDEDDNEDDVDDEEEEEEHLYMTEDEDDLFQDLLELPHPTEPALPLPTSNVTYQSTPRSVTPPAHTHTEDRNGSTSATHRFVL